MTGWQASRMKESIMQGKLALAAGFVAGYVLGSKAGRQRYEEIVAQARKVAGNQTVQGTAGVLQAQASELVNKAKQSDVVAKAKTAVGRGEDRGDAAPSTTTTYSTPSTMTGSADLFEPATTPTTPTSPTSPTNNDGSTP
jgi:hypothetical protein